MPVYVVSMMTVNDADTYSKYTAQTPALIKKHGGKFLTRGQKITTMEGTNYNGRMVILEFPSQEKLDAWYNDPEYQEAMKFRQAGSTMHYLMIQPGSDADEAPNPNL